MDFDALSLPWQMCAEEAWDAFLHKTVPIGACLIGQSGELISQGRNHIFDDDATDGVAPSIALHKLAHAEMNCLLGVHESALFRSATIYSTVEPCPLCMGAIYMAGVRHTCFAVPDPYAGSTNLLKKTPYLSVKESTVTPLEDPVYVNIMAAWNFYFFFFDFERRGETWWSRNIVMDQWREAMPEAHALASKIWEQYSHFKGPFMQMNVQESISFWEAEAEELLFSG